MEVNIHTHIYIGFWTLNMGYMDKRVSRMQGQFYFSKSGRVDDLHPGSEGGVPGADVI